MQYGEGLRKLVPPLEFRTHGPHWKSCTTCRRLSLMPMLSCSTHLLNLTQEEWAALPMKERQG